jgi:O-antigen ligase
VKYPTVKKKDRENRSSQTSWRVPLFTTLCAAVLAESLFFWPRFFDVYMVPKFVVLLIGGAVLLPQLCWVLLQRRNAVSLLPLTGLLALQLLAISWATVNSMSPVVSFWSADWRRLGWISHLAMIITALAVPLAISGDRARWRNLLRVITFAGCLGAIYGIVQWLGWDPFLPLSTREELIAAFGGYYRSPGTIGQATYYGSYLLYPFFSSMALLFCEAGVALTLPVTTMVLIAVAIGFAAAARGSVLGLAVGVLVMAGAAGILWLRRAKRPLSKRLQIGVAVLLSALLVTVAIGSRRLQTIGTDSSSIGRMLLWEDVLGRIVPKFWKTGTGPGMFRSAYAQSRSPAYGLFGADVHWETPHNVFLDRLSEQGLPGLVVYGILVAAFFINIIRSIRASSGLRDTMAFAAIGAGAVAALVSNSFNGEVIPTTYYFYLWIALSFSRLHSGGSSRSRGRSIPINRWILAIALLISGGMLWYAEKNWKAETILKDAGIASSDGDVRRLIKDLQNGEGQMPHVGTYHLELSNRAVNLLQQKAGASAESAQLIQVAINAASWARDRSDKPMVALINLIWLGGYSADGRTSQWINELEEADPYWYRVHESAARASLARGQFDEALKEATIACELAPYVESTVGLWRQMNALRRIR